ncbi:hypothetical protein PMIN01_02248 [Paraphaeosphaeria minitans]|uniref:Uncharacterized protein n=1 Tax=Paraphaeosphaeria minitans TaxID=565426 RepID=A0A9P6KV87_9PLEO|nr:hypothetical protein PMIN01_02248 [Paraphaeosphaeria minitans]
MSTFVLTTYGRIAQAAEAKNDDMIVHAPLPVSLQPETRKRNDWESHTPWSANRVIR